MTKYEKLMEKKQDDFNNVPKFFAFGNKQFEEQYKKFQENYPDVIGEKIYSIGAGGYTTKKYIDELVRLTKEYEEKEKELLQDQEILYKALIDNFWNIEYVYYQDDERMVDEILSKKIDDLTEQELETYKKARHDYMEEALKNW